MALFVLDKKKGCLVSVDKVPPRRTAGATWPMASETLACSDAGRVREDQEALAKHGVRTEYDEQFRPIFTSRSHRKAHMRALQFADPDAGYGDAEPLHCTKINRNERRSPGAVSKRLSEAREALIAKEYRLFGCRVSNY